MFPLKSGIKLLGLTTERDGAKVWVTHNSKESGGIKKDYW